ncbi:adenylyltransferase/cytidyltransferase family protein [Candidatus Daviesbacteria bacterium]|nr:adenylyltransferase/cytidyltransferase family protein [Candidatus Daviesbacteria bacterium]
MGKVVSVKNFLNVLKSLKNQKKTISLCGGCFDLIHPGHIHFLTKAKQQADFLVILLENDLNIVKRKGNHRPVFNQKARSQVLSSLSIVDYVVNLPFMATDQQYDQIVKKICPDIIVTSKGDPNIDHKQRQAQLTNAKLLKVSILKNFSTTCSIKFLKDKKRS